MNGASITCCIRSICNKILKEIWTKCTNIHPKALPIIIEEKSQRLLQTYVLISFLLTPEGLFIKENEIIPKGKKSSLFND